jgi:predicted nucleic acid-binding protein
VVDASVAVKWIIEDGEDAVSDARWLLEVHARGQLVLAVPGTFRLEWLNALRSRKLSVPDILSAGHELQRAALEWHEVDEALSFEAVSLAASHGLTVYDAAYLALANRLDAGLVTADRALAEAAGERLVSVVDIPADSRRAQP